MPPTMLLRTYSGTGSHSRGSSATPREGHARLVMANPRQRVIVLGSGAAGMAAAAAAATGGAHVTVLESAHLLGGTTAWSGGGIWIPVNGKAENGTGSDSRDEALRYLRTVSIGDSDPDLLEAYVREGARVVSAIEVETPLRWHQIVGYPDYHAELDGGQLDGRSLEIDPVQVAPELLSRLLPNPYGKPPVTMNEDNAGFSDPAEIARRQRLGVIPRGRGLIGGLASCVLERGGEIRTGVRASRLLVSNQVVVGVEAGGARFEGQVVIATGGFERDAALVRSFLRGPMLAPGGVPNNVGDGLRMGMTAGAALANMSEAWWCPAMEVPGETAAGAPFYRMLFSERALPGLLVVDSRGRRFANEAANYNDFGRSLHEFDPARYEYPRVPSWIVFDALCRHQHQIGPLTGDEPDPPWLARANTIEDLAARIGVPPPTLYETVERFNRLATAGVDDDFGRGAYAWDRATARRAKAAATLRPLTEPAFYAVKVLPGCLGTKGGLKIDAGGRVVRADGSGVIPGLFAAGNAAANPFGHAYPGAGGTIGPALVFGWCAGETAALG